MKATLTYNLPDEQGEFDAALAGRKALSALWEIDSWCRDLLKHGDSTEQEARLAEKIRDMIPSELLDL